MHLSIRGLLTFPSPINTSYNLITPGSGPVYSLSPLLFTALSPVCLPPTSHQSFLLSLSTLSYCSSSSSFSLIFFSSVWFVMHLVTSLSLSLFQSPYILEFLPGHCTTLPTVLPLHPPLSICGLFSPSSSHLTCFPFVLYPTCFFPLHLPIFVP